MLHYLLSPSYQSLTQVQFHKFSFTNNCIPWWASAPSLSWPWAVESTVPQQFMTHENQKRQQEFTLDSSQSIVFWCNFMSKREVQVTDFENPGAIYSIKPAYLINFLVFSSSFVSVSHWRIYCNIWLLLIFCVCSLYNLFILSDKNRKIVSVLKLKNMSYPTDQLEKIIVWLLINNYFLWKQKKLKKG